ncbi:MAG: S41 family peptidase [Bacteroidota bacterium]
MSNNSGRLQSYLPLLLVLFLGAGLLIGSRFSLFKQELFKTSSNDSQKTDEILSFILENYVDTVNTNALNTAAIEGMLGSLDPHSAYISKDSYHEFVDPIKGNFEGVGIQFRIVNDTIVVIQPVHDGPSEKAGIMAGDRIVTVNNENVAGKKITDEEVLKKLKGPKGSVVKVGIYRNGSPKILAFSLSRDVIPTYSIDADYMINSGIGYVKLSRFAATTGHEFESALASLKSQGMTKLILDLRGNSGGYLDAATALADEFLPDKKMIVYTQGHKRAKQVYYATTSGLFEKGDLYILIDEYSASASEILAGAIQDNDRGTIIGRRSFGKGLVQEQIELKDGSALRLTVARYFTPSGRCIQKPYSKGVDDYNHEFLKRYSDGEMEHPDSIHFADSLKFKTSKGRLVYGGGGIMPDVYVALDRKDPVRQFFYHINNTATLYQYTFEYTDKQRNALKKFKNFTDFDAGFKVSDAMIKDFMARAAKDSIARNPKLLTLVKPDLEILIKSFISRNLYDDAGFYPLYNQIDKTMITAVEIAKK